MLIKFLQINFNTELNTAKKETKKWNNLYI